MNHRSDAPHGASQDSDGSDDLASTLPSHQLHPESDEVRYLLEELDDVVFQAIRGDAESLEAARRLWPQVVREIGRDLVEESREQYLRYSTDLARRFEHQDIRDPHCALAAIEIIELLLRDD